MCTVMCAPIRALQYRPLALVNWHEAVQGADSHVIAVQSIRWDHNQQQKPCPLLWLKVRADGSAVHI
jgi:hypothetical protein